MSSLLRYMIHSVRGQHDSGRDSILREVMGADALETDAGLGYWAYSVSGALIADTFDEKERLPPIPMQPEETREYTTTEAVLSDCNKEIAMQAIRARAGQAFDCLVQVMRMRSLGCDCLVDVLGDIRSASMQATIRWTGKTSTLKITLCAAIPGDMWPGYARSINVLIVHANRRTYSNKSTWGLAYDRAKSAWQALERNIPGLPDDAYDSLIAEMLIAAHEGGKNAQSGPREKSPAEVWALKCHDIGDCIKDTCKDKAAFTAAVCFALWIILNIEGAQPGHIRERIERGAYPMAQQLAENQHIFYAKTNVMADNDILTIGLPVLYIDFEHGHYWLGHWIGPVAPTLPSWKPEYPMDPVDMDRITKKLQLGEQHGLLRLT